MRSFGKKPSLFSVRSVKSKRLNLGWLKTATRTLVLLCTGLLGSCLVGCVTSSSGSHGQPGKQQSLEQWRRLTEKSAAPPKVFVDHNQIRFYFWPETNVMVEFKAKLTPADKAALIEYMKTL